jgi:integrase
LGEKRCVEGGKGKQVKNQADLCSVGMFKLFDQLLKNAGLTHMRFHDLRHSAATLLLSMGVNPKVVQEILGHSTISMTMDVYSHVLPSMQQEAMGKWDDALGSL